MPSMQYDVLASAPVTSDGAVENQAGDALPRVRIKSLYGTLDTAGTVVLYDGGSNTASKLISVPVPAATVQGTFWLPMPGEGILAENGIYAELGGAESLVVIYG